MKNCIALHHNILLYYNEQSREVYYYDTEGIRDSFSKIDKTEFAIIDGEAYLFTSR